MSMVEKLWQKVSDWWSSEAVHLSSAFYPDPAGAALRPHQSYLRVWVSEMFLAHDRQRGVDRYPAVQASIRLRFAGSDGATFSTIVRPPQGQEGPGVRRDHPLTELLPYAGGVLDLQVGLLDVEGVNHVALALDVLGDFASLLAPPLSTALTVADKVAGGIGKIDAALSASGQRPLLALERSLVSSGGGGAATLQPGCIAVIRASETDVPPGSCTVVDGYLYRNVNGQLEHLTGHDYMVVRIEARAERDDWRFPEWDRLIGQAQAAQIGGKVDDAKALRQEVLSRIVLSGDLTPVDRKRVAKLVKDELDAFELGAAAEERLGSVSSLVAQRGLPDRSAAEALTLDELLT